MAKKTKKLLKRSHRTLAKGQAPRAPKTPVLKERNSEPVPESSLVFDQRLHPCLGFIKYLLPPFDSDEGGRDRLATAIRAALPCEAVSIFFVGRDDDQKTFVLKLRSKSGYKETYRDQRFDLDQASSLASYVYRTEEPLNESKMVLSQRNEIPSSPLKFFLPSEELRNVLAVPIPIPLTNALGDK